MKYTPDNITSLEPNQIFVFDSNQVGWHGAGAARLAFEKFGAEYRVGQGPTGKSYALPTKDAHIETLPLTTIERNVYHFMAYARMHPHLEFLVTKIGCGLADYEPEDIAPMFIGHPSNVILPKEFADLL